MVLGFCWGFAVILFSMCSCSVVCSKKHKEEACSAVVGVDLGPEEKAEAVERDESEAPLTGLSDVQLKDLGASLLVANLRGIS